MISIHQDNNNELLPVVDEGGRLTGCATRGECHSGKGLLHPVVHLHVLNQNGELFLQQRPKWKDVQPGKWDTAVGGHVDWGEDVRTALFREVNEEIGLTDFQPILLSKYIHENKVEKELVNSFYIVTDQIPKPTEELDGGRFWTLQEIETNIAKEVFTPNFEDEFNRTIKTLLEKHAYRAE